jgi:DNA-binding NarL/FixJ family response regulator
LRFVLESEPGFEVVCEASDGLEAVTEAVKHDVDLAVLDITMPGMGGLQAAREICQRRPATRILMLSVHDDAQYIAHAQKAGAHGYVLKAVADNELISACHRVVQASLPSFIQPVPRQTTARKHGWHSDAALESVTLTPREAEILALVAEGHSAKDIADMLVISSRTVDRHRENLCAKLGLHNRAELTRYAIRIGLVEP